jgi:hypothetical protein
MDSMDSLGWEMEWGSATIYDAMWVFGIFAALLYAMYIRAVGDVIPSGEQHNQDVNEQAGSFPPAVIDASIPAERRESAI